MTAPVRRRPRRAQGLSSSRVALALFGTCLALAAGCLQGRYVVQAAVGQAELWARARPIDEVISDPDTPRRTAVLLGEVAHIRRFADENGLDSKDNYLEYVDLERSAVVWFMTACQPLAFEPATWSFPIAGSFPYLGWFDLREALTIKRRIAASGLDAYLRGVRAYSTGGWFDDPVLSSMLSDEDDAFRYLAGVLFHELTHANIFVPDQSIFNESLASFVGDGLTDDYLAWRFGEDSDEVRTYRAELAEQKRVGERLARAYAELDALYKSERSREHKLRKKKKVLDELERELDLRFRPNNAFLIGYKTYNTGGDELERLFAACGRSWPRFLSAIGGLDRDSFDAPQDETFGELVVELVPECVTTAQSGPSHASNALSDR